LKKDEARETVHMADSVERRIAIIERFVQAKRVMKRDPQGMIEICTSLLSEPNLEEAIRAGDCYAMIVEYFHSVGDMREAYRYTREMESKQVQVSLYIDADIMQAINQAVGIRNDNNNRKINTSNNKGLSHNTEIDESVGEEEDHVQFHDSNNKSNSGNNRGSGGGGRSSSGILNDSKEDEIDEEIGEEEEVEEKPSRKPGYANYNSSGSSSYGNKNSTKK